MSLMGFYSLERNDIREGNCNLWDKDTVHPFDRPINYFSMKVQTGKSIFTSPLYMHVLASKHNWQQSQVFMWPVDHTFKNV